MFKLDIYKRYGDNIKKIRGEIKKFIEDVLESRGIVQEIS